jgi:hypothetical protein
MSIYPPTGTLEIKNATLKIPVVDLQYTSNTAKLEANSNVVTEFSRSKKLIKYPRVALTSASQDGYVVTSYEGTTSGAENYNAFNGIKTGTDRWSPSGPAYTSGSWNNTQSNGTTQDVNGTTWTGEWLQIQLPNKIALKSHIIQSRSSHTHRMVKKGVILGSNTNGTTWNLVDSWSGLNSKNEREVSIDSINYYDYYRLVSIQLAINSDAVRTDIQEWDLYGIPEYDPEAHGTDVTVKSYPNVPNTDWLEVYYDAKDLTSISGTIADLSGKSVTGSLNGDVSIDTLNDVKSFSFDGSGDYIKGNLTNTGDFDFTVSLWLKKNTSGTVGMLWNLGGSGGSGNPEDSVALEVGANNNLDYFIFSGAQGAISNFGVDYLNKWVHIVATRTGIDLKIYLDGVDQNLSVSGTDTLQLAANTEFTIGARGTGALGNNPLNGSIANFRIFNRALTSDEIYQLYAYQKEYFGHGDLSMTLKAGRLGIGTSEPRVALDVRGEIRAVGSMLYLLDTPLTHEWHWSGSTSATTGSEQRIHYNQFPPNCRAIYADVFLPMASAGDHGTHVLGESWLAIGRTWTDGRSLTTATTNDARPSTYMTTGVTQGAKVVYIGQPSQSDNFEYYYGNWWQSLIIPLGDGNNLYHGRTGYGGTHGWIYVYTKGYYV